MKKLFLGLTVAFSLTVAHAQVTTDSTKNYKYCETVGIEKKYDKFTGKTTFNTPMKNGLQQENVVFLKVIPAEDTSYALYLMNISTKSYYYQKGVIILLSDGSKMEFADTDVKCETFSVSAYASTFKFSSIIPLTEEQVKTFQEKRITDYRLYLLDATLKEKLGKRYQEYLTCLIHAF